MLGSPAVVVAQHRLPPAPAFLPCLRYGTNLRKACPSTGERVFTAKRCIASRAPSVTSTSEPTSTAKRKVYKRVRRVQRVIPVAERREESTARTKPARKVKVVVRAQKPSTPTTASHRSSSSSAQTGSCTPTNPFAQNPLLYPDHREDILRFFQEMAEVNTAVGEIYKAKSYQFAIHQLRRSDFIYRCLPPNLLPLSREGYEQLLKMAHSEPGRACYVPDMKSNWERRQHVADAGALEKSLQGVGEKLRKKMIEILETGDLEELREMQSRPEVRAMRELCGVHGYGPRSALNIYRKHGIRTIDELRKLSALPAASSPVAFTDGQRVGLHYYDDIEKKIPHEEGKLHEAFMKAKLEEHFGDAFQLVICGSFRRQTPFSGDIDVLLSPHPSRLIRPVAASGGKAKQKNTMTANAAHHPLKARGLKLPVPPQDAVAAFVAALQEDGYIEASLALGCTKFMGIGRLKGCPPTPHSPTNIASTIPFKPQSSTSSKKTSNACRQPSTPPYPARRIDVRYVDALCFPAAQLYFTGSKNFNVVMRARAVKLGYVLNEYGLFKQDFAEAARLAGSGKPLTSISELISRLTKLQYWIRSDAGMLEKNEQTKKKSNLPALTSEKQMEMEALVRQLNYLRFPVTCEKDIFDVIGMAFQQPWDRCL